MRPYDLRHSYCAAARDASVDPHTLRIWMGHSDISMIMRVYDHVSEERIEKEAENSKTPKIGAWMVKTMVRLFRKNPLNLDIAGVAQW